MLESSVFSSGFLDAIIFTIAVVAFIIPSSSQWRQMALNITACLVCTEGSQHRCTDPFQQDLPTVQTIHQSLRTAASEQFRHVAEPRFKSVKEQIHGVFWIKLSPP